MAICTVLFLISNIGYGGIIALPGCYATRIRSYLPTFRDNISRWFVPKRRYVITNPRCVTSLESKYLIYTAAEHRIKASEITVFRQTQL